MVWCSIGRNPGYALYLQPVHKNIIDTKQTKYSYRNFWCGWHTTLCVIYSFMDVPLNLTYMYRGISGTGEAMPLPLYTSL